MATNFKYLFKNIKGERKKANIWHIIKRIVALKFGSNQLVPSFTTNFPLSYVILATIKADIENL